VVVGASQSGASPAPGIAARRSRAFTPGERQIEVTAIQDRWLVPVLRHVEVAQSDGDIYILHHGERTGECTPGAFRRGVD
jgi:hypothetical protein